MVKVLLINKNSSLKISKFNNFDVNQLYKKCNFQNNNNFEKHHTWKNKDSYYSIFAKDVGRAGSENKYDLPPPLDKTDILYFGNLVIVKHDDPELDNHSVCDINLNEWNQFYEKQFGGFEDLGESDSFSEEEVIPKELQTKDGYLKDGFVVDDDDEIEELKSDSDVESVGSGESENELDSDIEDNVMGSESEDNIMGSESDYNSENDSEVGSDNDYDSDYNSDELGSELSEESYDSD